MLRSLAALASAVVVLALPMGALAMHGPGDGSESHSLPTPTNYLFDGKYLDQASSPRAIDVVSAPRAGGFDYGDAAVGAGVGALVIVIVGGTVLVVRHEHNGRHLVA
ncbi:MAG TPA: hypothetical protein VMT74_10615 [Gaiellaceae bacterium]|nr:hypothetical protein [Gaiellaceae bacterium]